MVRDNLYVLLTGKYIEGVTDLDRLSNAAVCRIFWKRMKDFVEKRGAPLLSKDEEQEVLEFYGPYRKPDLLYHRGYKAWTGKFLPDYIPDDICFGDIEPYYTDRLCSKYLDNKCFYYRLFSNVKNPGLIAMRIGGIWLDDSFKIINEDKVCEILLTHEEAVLKKATDSQGGFGLTFLEGEDKVIVFRKTIANVKTDLVIQEKIKQHPAYARLNESSVNTYRLMSLLRGEEVWIFASTVRIGRPGRLVDNVSEGGILVGVREDGHLTDLGTLEDGTMVSSHPELGYSFSDITPPFYEKAVELVKNAHGIMAHCALASWDVAIDEEGEAVLVEANLALGVLCTTQAVLGPIFGDRTEEILDEVFYKKDGSRRKKPYLGLNPRDYYYVRDNVLGCLFGTYRTGYTHIALLGNPALKVIDRKLIKEVSGLFPELSSARIEEIRDYYRPYKKDFTTESHRVYCGKSGVFYKDYIPEDMYMCDIDRYLSDRDLAYYLDNKCYYARLFPDARQPETFVMRIGKVWLDKDYMPISPGKVMQIIFSKEEVVVKAATCSEGGKGVRFISFGNEASFAEKKKILKKALKGMKEDIIIQAPIRQHPDLAKLHPRSINTLRIVSLIIDGKVVILSRSLKVGAGESRLDNGSSGGIYCGVDEDGSLREIGALDDGRVVRQHPDLGYSFKGIKVPCLDKCDELIKAAHPFMGHHRLISWDIAVDEEGNAVLIEANLVLGGSDDVQVVNGPFFGEYTEQVLKEVYGDK